VPVSAGALSSGAQVTGTAVVPLHQEIVATLNRSSVVVPDETGWRVGGEGAWLWVLTSRDTTAYSVAQGRGFEDAKDLLDELMNEREALFTFLTHDDVDATNWRAEQAIRPAVVNRKVWGGNRTWRGAATQGRIMSVLRTAIQRGIDPIEFLVRHARAPDPATVSLFH
jgi:hypothetical protein